MLWPAAILKFVSGGSWRALTQTTFASASTMPNILITGAASGIGKTLVQLYSDNLYKQQQNSRGPFEHTSISAIDIAFLKLVPQPPPSTSKALVDPVSVFGGLHRNVRSGICHAPDSWLREHVELYAMDVSEDRMDYFFWNVYSSRPLDLIIHCAGIRGLSLSQLPSSGCWERSTDAPGPAKVVARAESIDSIDREVMMRTLEVNTLGTFQVLSNAVPAFKLAAQRGPSKMPKVVVMGSRMGSIASNSSGGGYAYRASKAALNAIVKTISLDVPEVIWTVVHPGRVETSLVPGMKEEGAADAFDACQEVLRLISDLNRLCSGRFMDRFGKEIPW